MDNNAIPDDIVQPIVQKNNFSLRYFDEVCATDLVLNAHIFGIQISGYMCIFQKSDALLGKILKKFIRVTRMIF